jgi:AcrR family transcriptional regulator
MTDPIQEQLVAARKTQILDAAAEVFAQKGFHQTTTKDIARQAGIAEGTIYNYFENKPALLIGIFERMRTAVVQGNLPTALPEMDQRTFIRTVLLQPLAALQHDNFALFRIVLSESVVNEDLRRLFYAQILEPTLRMAEPYFEAQGMPPAEAQITIRAIAGMMLGLIVERILGDDTLIAEWDRLADVTTDLILNGIRWESRLDLG